MNKDTEPSAFAIIPYPVYDVVVLQLIKGIFSKTIISPCFRESNDNKSELQWWYRYWGSKTKLFCYFMCVLKRYKTYILTFYQDVLIFLLKDIKITRLKPPTQISIVKKLFFKKESLCLMHRLFSLSAKSLNTANLFCSNIFNGRFKEFLTVLSC